MSTPEHAASATVGVALTEEKHGQPERKSSSSARASMDESGVPGLSPSSSARASMDESGVPGLSPRLPVMPSKNEAPCNNSNIGSVGHPEFCHKACRFFRKGECERGSACDFCHCCAYDSNFKLDAPNKKTLRKMCPDSLDVLLATLVRERLEEIEVSPSGSRLVWHWLSTFEDALPRAELEMLKFPGIKPSSTRRLLRALGNMNLHGLCGVARSAQKDSVVAGATESLLESLRKSGNQVES